MPLPSVILDAAAASERIEELIEQASSALDSATSLRVLNGFGIFKDQLGLERDLTEARAALDKAITAMAETAWPIHADYAAAGGPA